MRFSTLSLLVAVASAAFSSAAPVDQIDKSGLVSRQDLLTDGDTVAADAGTAIGDALGNGVGIL